MKPLARGLTRFNAFIQNSMHIPLWAKLWVVRTWGKLYYEKAIKAPIMLLYINAMYIMQWCITEHAKYLKAKDTEFIVLLTWQQLKCQHEVISFLTVFSKNIRRLIYGCNIVTEGYRQPCCHSGTVFSLILQPSEKDRKMYWIVLPLKDEISYYFCCQDYFYQWGLKNPVATSIYLKKSYLFMPL